MAEEEEKRIPLIKHHKVKAYREKDEKALSILNL
jgi:hypothetical protein